MFQGFRFTAVFAFFCVLAFLAATTTATATEAPPAILLEKSYDFGDNDLGTEITMVEEGLLIGGSIGFSDRSDLGRFWAVVGLDGSVISHQQVAQDGFYQLLTAMKTADGEVVTGIANDTFQCTMTKRDVNGAIVWSRSYDPGGWGGYPLTSTMLDDGGFVILGTVAGIDGDPDYADDIMFIRTDAEGNQQWLKTYGLPGRARDTPRYVGKTDTGFMLVGNHSNPGASSDQHDAQFILTDDAGNVVSKQSLGAETEVAEFVTSITQAPAGHFVMLGHYGDWVNYFARFMVEVDESGTLVRRLQIPALENNVTRDMASVITRTSDGGYLIAGSRGYRDHHGEYYLMKLDRAWENVWTWTKPAELGIGFSFTGVISTPEGQHIVLGGEYRPPPVYTSDTHLILTASDSKLFIRGDSNGDGKLDISDPIRTLNYLFAGGVTIACQDAADANDDGGVDISDAVFSLNFLFAGGKDIPPPNTMSGMDPTDDTLGCGLYYSLQ